jgi:stage II sporulation protein D
LLKIIFFLSLVSFFYSRDINISIVDGKEPIKIVLNSYVILYSSEARYQFGPSDSPLLVEASENFFTVISSNKNRFLKFSSDIVMKPQLSSGALVINDEYNESGKINISLISKFNLQVIAEKDLEEYIAYVTYHEIFTNKVSDIEAIKAQSVAARTYTLKSIGQYNGFDVYSDTRDQVYRSNIKLPKMVLDAVKSTKGEVLTFNEKLILSKYCANLGGSREIPNYLDAEVNDFQHNINLNEIDDLGKLSKYYRWRYTFTFKNLLSRLKTYIQVIELDTLVDNTLSFEILERNQSGRIIELTVLLNQKRVLSLKKLEIRKFFKISNSILPSNLFYFKKLDLENIELIGGGHGHGEGMGQWEAIELSRNNYSYKEILTLFYPNVSISEVRL